MQVVSTGRYEYIESTENWFQGKNIIILNENIIQNVRINCKF